MAKMITKPPKARAPKVGKVKMAVPKAIPNPTSPEGAPGADEADAATPAVNAGPTAAPGLGGAPMAGSTFRRRSYGGRSY